MSMPRSLWTASPFHTAPAPRPAGAASRRRRRGRLTRRAQRGPHRGHGPRYAAAPVTVLVRCGDLTLHRLACGERVLSRCFPESQGPYWLHEVSPGPRHTERLGTELRSSALRLGAAPRWASGPMGHGEGQTGKHTGRAAWHAAGLPHQRPPPCQPSRRTRLLRSPELQGAWRAGSHLRPTSSRPCTAGWPRAQPQSDAEGRAEEARGPQEDAQCQSGVS